MTISIAVVNLVLPWPLGFVHSIKNYYNDNNNMIIKSVQCNQGYAVLAVSEHNSILLYINK